RRRAAVVRVAPGPSPPRRPSRSNRPRPSPGPRRRPTPTMPGNRRGVVGGSAPSAPDPFAMPFVRFVPSVRSSPVQARATTGLAMVGAAAKPRRTATFLSRLAMLLALAFVALARPAFAQTILRDAETEALFRDMSRPLVEAAGLRPDNVQIVLLQDPQVNAFVAGGQIVYLQTGLIVDARNVNEVQGVVAHELGH